MPWESPRGEAEDCTYLCSLILRLSFWLAYLSGGALLVLIPFLSKEASSTVSACSSGTGGWAEQAVPYWGPDSTLLGLENWGPQRGLPSREAPFSGSLPWSFAGHSDK